MISLLATAAALALGDPVMAGGPHQALDGSGTVERVNPRWTRPPDPDMASGLYPRFALFLGLSARVTLTCWVRQDGPPVFCEPSGRFPRGVGFETAAQLITTTGRLSAAREDGEVVPSRVRYTANFAPENMDEIFGGWDEPEPTDEQLALAAEAYDLFQGDAAPAEWRDAMLGGLDYDRRIVVREWVEELLRPELARDSQILQMARLFSADQLRAIMAGEEVSMPAEDRFWKSCPEPDAQQLAAIEELKRRYCERYGCEPL